MSPVEFKKSLSRPVEFKGQGSHYYQFCHTTFLSSMILVIYACSNLITSHSFIPYERLIQNWVFGLFPHFNYLRMKYIVDHCIDKSK